MNELLTEVWTSMKSNRMRIGLTGFSIGWGMFILVVLLGSSNGFQDGLYKTFSLDLPQIVSVSTGKTSKTWQGLNKGRTVTMHMADAEALKQSGLDHVKKVRPSITKSLQVECHNRIITVPVTGCGNDFLVCDFRKVVSGRDIDELDMQAKGKVCVINKKVAAQFFGDKSPLGHTLSIGSIPYLIVGVCDIQLSNEMGLAAYIPLSTMMSIYNPDNTVDRISVIIDDITTHEENEAFTNNIQHFFASRLQCDPTDNKGVQVSNEFDQALNAKIMIDTIGIFVWIIGIATLIAGIVGVSNIMMITVKERTRELGVRKAMGATDLHIVSLVILEAVIITMIFGYIGIMTGVGLTQLLNVALGDAFPMFQNPTVQFWAIMGCNGILILAGIIAGYVPAKRSVDIKLVDALAS